MYTKLYNGTIFKQVSPTETIVFPEDPQNQLYIEYQEWLTEGNTPSYFPSPEEALKMIAEKSDAN